MKRSLIFSLLFHIVFIFLVFSQSFFIFLNNKISVQNNLPNLNFNWVNLELSNNYKNQSGSLRRLRDSPSAISSNASSNATNHSSIVSNRIQSSSLNGSLNDSSNDSLSGSQSDSPNELNNITNRYLSELKLWIEKNKIYPRDAKILRQQGSVEVSFKIDKNGKFFDVKLTKSCEYEKINEAAIDLIKKIDHFKPLDKELFNDLKFIEVNLPIKYELD
jgi:TonB family protein